MFKRYADAAHWGIFIPISFRRESVYDWHSDSMQILRKHWVLTWKSEFIVNNMIEIRIRFGIAYL